MSGVSLCSTCVAACCCVQFVLAPKPSTAFFLRPEERAWLASRQSTLDARQDAKHPRQGKWWACLPGERHTLLQRSGVGHARQVFTADGMCMHAPL